MLLSTLVSPLSKLLYCTWTQKCCKDTLGNVAFPLIVTKNTRTYVQFTVPA